MDTFLESAAKRLKGLWAPLVIFFAVVPIVLIVLLVNHYAARPAYIENWEFSHAAAKTCPPFGKYPIPVCNATGRYTMAWTEAVVEWNKETSAMGFGDVFVRDCKNPKAIKIRPAAKSYYKTGRACEHLRLGETKFWPDYYGWVQFTHKPYHEGTHIYICTDKYDRGVELMKTKAAEELRKIGIKGILKHELGHLLLGAVGSKGDKTAHVKYGELMAKSIVNLSVSSTTKDILRKKVFNACKRKE